MFPPKGNPGLKSPVSQDARKTPQLTTAKLPPGNPLQAPNTSQAVTFFVKIQGLQPNYDKQANRAQHNPQGFWAPPNIKEAYSRQTISYFKWTGGVLLSLPPASAPNVGTLYREATIFSQQGDTDHLLAVNFDAQLRNVRDTLGGWRVLSFNHVPRTNRSTYSKVNLFGEEQQLAAKGCEHWMPQLLPAHYDYQRTDAQDNPIPAETEQAGLIGDLAILISLAAFSAPRDRLTAVLTSSIGPGVWRRHDLPTGRRSYRG